MHYDRAEESAPYSCQGMYNYVQPIVASVIGVCLGLDRFTPVKIVAVALIFSGVYLVTISRAAAHDAHKIKGGKE